MPIEVLTALHPLVVAFLSSLGTILVAWFPVKATLAKQTAENKINVQAMLQNHVNDVITANQRFREEVRGDLDRSKQRERELEDKVRDLENRLTELGHLNERLVAEKIEWMTRAMNLKLLLDEAILRRQLSPEAVEQYTKQVTQLEQEANINHGKQDA